MPVSSTSRDPFELITENSSRDPHRFKAYRYDRTHGDCWSEVVEGCLESWRIKAEAFYERLPETGFKPIGLNKILNNYGRTQLPPTPLEEHTVTKEPAITDMTEVLALKVLEWKEQELVLPYPRVLHKESFKLQHHGIDALGYRENPEGYYTLYVIEVMASVENNHPPATVKRHLNQILPETLNAPDPERLLQDLQTVHDESSDKHRSILNGFIIATLDGALSSTDSVMATSILIRRYGEFHENDWDPFLKSMDTLRKLEGQDVTFGIDLVNSYKSLSAFLQFLVHALAVVGEESFREELEDLLRSSLAYLEAQKESQAMADQLIRLARNYIDDLERRKGSRLSAFAKLADGTGFSSPSVDKIFLDWRNQTQLFEWKAADLFPVEGKASSTLSDVMRTLGTIPEIRLGDHESGTFNPVRIARITTAWVNGRSLLDIATNEYNGDLLECTRHIYSAITNLVPWGLRAIQKVSFAGRDDVEWAEMDLIPAMVFHGVRSREAIALRMLNVPRFLAENMATRIRRLRIPLDKVDTWLSEASEDDWSRSLPVGASIEGSECKLLWEIVDGHKPWKSINEMNM